jgi:hypothetical protein
LTEIISASKPLVATKALGDESYTPDTPLAEDTTYYWVIVEQPGGYASAVMSFKTLYVPHGMFVHSIGRNGMTCGGKKYRR